MRVSDEGLALIKHHEGYSATPYLCPAQVWTIGYGHAMRPADVPKYRAGITREQGEALLRMDVRIAERAVMRLITSPLNQSQFEALVSFTFNLGAHRLQTSTLRQVINRGEYERAPAQFKRWVWGGGRKLQGLIRRRADEAELFMRELDDNFASEY